MRRAMAAFSGARAFPDTLEPPGIVVPAKAGTQGPLDSRFRGNDDKGGQFMRIGLCTRRIHRKQESP
jgi:hypothetical protein